MKLGDIKVEALKLMFADYVENMSIENLKDIQEDANFAGIVAAMPGAINRCYSRLEDSKVIPLKQALLNKSQGVESKAGIRFNLVELLKDFGSIDRVICENENGYNGNYDYIMETESTILLPLQEEYTIVYSPIVNRVTNGTDNETEIDLPDKIASIIPYYIKGDLFREDEPAEAGEARNLFEGALELMQTKITQRQTKVKIVYSMEE